MLLAWGSNRTSVIRRNAKLTYSHPQKILGRSQDLKTIVAGTDFIMAITQDGSSWLVEQNNLKRLHLPSLETACCQQSTLVGVGLNGEVYVWEITKEDPSEQKFGWQRLNNLPPIKSAMTRFGHIVLISEKGELFHILRNEWYHTRTFSQCEMVPAKEAVTEVAISEEGLYCLTNQGKVIAAYWQNLNNWRLVPYESKLIKIAVGDTLSAITHKGYLVSAPLTDGSSSFEIITKLAKRFTHLWALNDNYFALAEDRQLWVWGSNSQGQLGLCDYECRLKPFPMVSTDGCRIRQIALGTGFVCALVQSAHSSFKSTNQNLSFSLSDAPNSFLPPPSSSLSQTANNFDGLECLNDSQQQSEAQRAQSLNESAWNCFSSHSQQAASLKTSNRKKQSSYLNYASKAKEDRINKKKNFSTLSSSENTNKSPKSNMSGHVFQKKKQSKQISRHQTQPERGKSRKLEEPQSKVKQFQMGQALGCQLNRCCHMKELDQLRTKNRDLQSTVSLKDCLIRDITQKISVLEEAINEYESNLSARDESLRSYEHREAGYLQHIEVLQSELKKLATDPNTRVTLVNAKNSQEIVETYESQLAEIKQSYSAKIEDLEKKLAQKMQHMEERFDSAGLMQNHEAAYKKQLQISQQNRIPLTNVSNEMEAKGLGSQHRLNRILSCSGKNSRSFHFHQKQQGPHLVAASLSSIQSPSDSEMEDAIHRIEDHRNKISKSAHKLMKMLEDKK